MTMLAAPVKGLRRLPPYRPVVGTHCEVSGPNCDNDDGYTWSEVDILWSDETFVLYGRQGFWPTLHKWEHCLFREPVIAKAEGLS